MQQAFYAPASLLLISEAAAYHTPTPPIPSLGCLPCWHTECAITHTPHRAQVVLQLLCSFRQRRMLAWLGRLAHFGQRCVDQLFSRGASLLGLLRSRLCSLLRHCGAALVGWGAHSYLLCLMLPSALVCCQGLQSTLLNPEALRAGDQPRRCMGIWQVRLHGGAWGSCCGQPCLIAHIGLFASLHVSVCPAHQLIIAAQAGQTDYQPMNQTERMCQGPADSQPEKPTLTLITNNCYPSNRRSGRGRTAFQARYNDARCAYLQVSMAV